MKETFDTGTQQPTRDPILEPIKEVILGQIRSKLHMGHWGSPGGESSVNRERSEIKQRKCSTRRRTD